MAQKAASRYSKSPKIDAKESKDTAGASKSAKSEAADPPKAGDDEVTPKADTEATPKGGDATGTEGAPVNGEAVMAGDNATMHAREMADMSKRHIAEMGQTHRRMQRERKEMYARHSGVAGDVAEGAGDGGGDSADAA